MKNILNRNLKRQGDCMKNDSKSVRVMEQNHETTCGCSLFRVGIGDAN